MVFSSIQAYLDPANWQQNPNFQTENYDLLPPPQQPTPPPPPPLHHGGGDQAVSSRPGSMVERARMANIALPEPALKCPRCESTNTKFCYFNNYSLSQPRHFCKTCRRYWTRGGALRNVPVGGGCRRNKRSSKGSSSTSKSEPANSGSTNTSTLLLHSTNAATPTTNILQGLITSHVPQRHLLPPIATHINPAGCEMDSNHGQISAPIITTTSEMNFDVGGYNNLFGGSTILSSSGGLEQWPRMHHAPQLPNFLGGFDPSISQGRVLYHSNYQHGGINVGAKLSSSSAMMSEDQLALVKMEANNNNNNYSNAARQLLGNEHYWSNVSTTTAWTDVSGVSSSSTSNPL